MSSNLVCDIDIFKTGNVLNRSQPRNSPDSTTCRAEKVIENPVITGERIDKPPRDDRANLTPGLCRGCERGTQQKHVLHDPKCLLLRQLEHRVENDTCTKGETNEGDRSNSKVPVYQNLGKDTTCPSRAV